MTNFLFYFAILLSLAYFCGYFLSHSFLGFKWRLFVAPGVIFHELCHALACKLTFARITKISFFDKDGGSVTYEKSPIPVFGQILISTAPLILGILVFYLLAAKIQLQASLDYNHIFENYKTLFSSIDFSNWPNLLIIYLLISVAVTMTPSRQDFVNMLLPLAALALVFFLIFKYSSLDLASIESLALKVSLVLILVNFILLLIFAASLALYFISKLILKT